MNTIRKIVEDTHLDLAPNEMKDPHMLMLLRLSSCLLFSLQCPSPPSTGPGRPGALYQHPCH